MPTKPELQVQLQQLRDSGLATKLAQQATAHGLAPEFLFAIASRETDCINKLGDVQNGVAHGIGILQIDVQHDIARQARDEGSWKTNPDPLIAFGAQMLADSLRQVRTAFAAAPPEQQRKITASGYNCGLGRAMAVARNGGDCDQHTTKGNYGTDVIARMKVFAELLGGESGQSPEQAPIAKSS